MAVQKVLDSTEKTQAQGWCIQLIGPICHFSTINVTNYGYHVNVPQFSLSFPSIVFGMEQGNALDNLFSFMDKVEKSALALKHIVKSKQERILLSSHHSEEPPTTPEQQGTPIDPTWYTPPRNDSSNSVIPYHL